MKCKQPKLFNVEKPKAPRRVLMHVWDAGPDTQFEEGGFDEVRFGCKRCGYETDWVRRRRSEAKCGEPCPACNHPDSKDLPPCASSNSAT